MKIAVLAGGLSPERNVSLTSGSLIAAALRRRGHRVCMIDVYVGLKENISDPDTLFTTKNDEVFSVSKQVPDLNRLKKENGNRAALIGPGVLEVCHLADVAFLALHGAMGENGQLQALLDVYGIP